MKTKRVNHHMRREATSLPRGRFVWEMIGGGYWYLWWKGNAWTVVYFRRSHYWRLFRRLLGSSAEILQHPYYDGGYRRKEDAMARVEAFIQTCEVSERLLPESREPAGKRKEIWYRNIPDDL
jgi:hypothetical protein